MQQPVLPPQAHHVEQGNYLSSLGWNATNDWGPRRSFPTEQPFIEYIPRLGGWFQGPKRIPNFRPKHYWTRPHDGKRSGTFGRLKDALTNQGPDVFITTSGDKRTLMRDRPQKWAWSGWSPDASRRHDLWADPDYREQDQMPVREAPWAKNSSRSGVMYNFRTRKYEVPQQDWRQTGAGANSRVWRDAQWRPGARTSDKNPYSYQTPNEDWWSRLPWYAEYWPGGRPLQ